jgi:hypothetical protein
VSRSPTVLAKMLNIGARIEREFTLSHPTLTLQGVRRGMGSRQFPTIVSAVRLISNEIDGSDEPR